MLVPVSDVATHLCGTALYLQSNIRVVLTQYSVFTGFWLTFISFIFLVLSGCTVCIGHRRAQGHDIELAGPFKRFRR